MHTHGSVHRSRRLGICMALKRPGAASNISRIIMNDTGRCKAGMSHRSLAGLTRLPPSSCWMSTVADASADCAVCGAGGGEGRRVRAAGALNRDRELASQLRS